MACEAVHAAAAAATRMSRSRRSCDGASAQEAVDYLAEPLLAGIHAGDVDRLSIRALFPRLLEAERQSGSVIRAFRALRIAAVAAGRVRVAAGRHRRARGRAGRRRLDARDRSLRRRACTDLHRTRHLPCRHRRRADRGTRGHSGRARVRRRRRCCARFDTTLAALCEGIPYASTATVAFGYRAIRSRIRCKAAASSCRASSEVRCSRPRGSRRNGRIARPTATCCCAAFSAAVAIRTAWTRTMTS